MIRNFIIKRNMHLLTKFKHVISSFLLLFSGSSYAQDHTFGSWAGWFNNVKFSAKWGLNNDIQFRAGTNWGENSMLLIRPGINYYVSPKQTVAAGYAATLVTNELPATGKRLTEHRLWQQYIITGKLGRTVLQHRFRLEQRFLMRPKETAFAQRARYFIRGMMPIGTSSGDTFTQGMFIALQNELFFNIQNKAALNGHFFDQNRAYAAVGHRFSPRYDLEIGYMNQFLLRNEVMPNMFTHIAQIAFYTRW
ncbi:DUF2490 domain-containing protein [Parapedobacter lycopersici]|uniref:DUF2490 domain-containing protein n=1 Tax=Parapedobacter lycopersici TaxID=1864939 RepID=UPI00214D713A|nr:DUF2490 domain-containing protein [Parapedobacter lycopersici]